MTTETEFVGQTMADLAARWVEQVAEMSALLTAEAKRQSDEIAELRDELHELALTFRRHQSKALLRDVDDAENERIAQAGRAVLGKAGLL